MHEIFGDLLGKDLTSVYIDDIALGQVTFHKHLQALERVFQRLRDANLTVNVKKCHFAMPQVKLSGFILTESGIAQDHDKIRSVKEWSRLVTVTDVRSFLGVVSFYRIFILRFSEITNPLTQL
jgi:hypothetical protein